MSSDIPKKPRKLISATVKWLPSDPDRKWSLLPHLMVDSAMIWPAWFIVVVLVELVLHRLGASPLQVRRWTGISGAAAIVICGLAGWGSQRWLTARKQDWLTSRKVLANSDHWQKQVALARHVVLGLSLAALIAALARWDLLERGGELWSLAPLMVLSPAILSAGWVYRLPALDPLDDELNQQIRQRAFRVGFWIGSVALVAAIWGGMAKPDLNQPLMLIALWLGAAGVAVSHLVLERRADRDG